MPDLQIGLPNSPEQIQPVLSPLPAPVVDTAYPAGLDAVYSAVHRRERRIRAGNAFAHFERRNKIRWQYGARPVKLPVEKFRPGNIRLRGGIGAGVCGRTPIFS